MTTALLALADGRIFRGESCGATGEAHGEVVFNVSMMGYQEIHSSVARVAASKTPSEVPLTSAGAVPVTP